MTYLPFRLWPLTSFALLVALPACQDPLHHTSDPHVFRCEKDGLCVITEKIGTRSLIGGFRRGNEEMKFEVLHRPVADPLQNAWCNRLQDTLGERIYVNDGPGCPEGWANGSYTGVGHGTIQEPNDRAVMMGQMIQELKAGRAPKGREEAWTIITELVEDFYDNRTSEMYEANQRKYFPDVPTSASGDYNAIGDPNYDGHTPPNIPYPPMSKKKVSSP